jgi:hypothetical protein
MNEDVKGHARKLWPDRALVHPIGNRRVKSKDVGAWRLKSI